MRINAEFGIERVTAKFDEHLTGGRGRPPLQQNIMYVTNPVGDGVLDVPRIRTNNKKTKKKGTSIMNNTKMNITSGTVARTIILILALVNQLLTATGHSVINISDENINTLISTGFTIVTAIVAWWKNNSFTQSALKADEVMREGKENASRTSD